MTIYIVWAESNDWCGVMSEAYRIDADSEEKAIDLAGSYGILEDEVLEHYDDEDDEDYIPDPSITIHSEEYSVEGYGALEGYRKLN